MTGFLDQRNNGFMQLIKENLNQLTHCNYSQGCLLFLSSLYVAIPPKMNQSSEDLSLFGSHSQDCSNRVSSQGTSILLRSSYIDAIIE